MSRGPLAMLDLAGIGTVLAGLAAIAGAVNTMILQVHGKRGKRMEVKLEEQAAITHSMVQALRESNERSDTAAKIAGDQAAALLVFLQGRGR